MKSIVKQVKSDLDAKLVSLGYSRIENEVYVAPWSSDLVTTFVFLDWIPKATSRIAVNVGVRHQTAQDFASEMCRTFGPSPLRQFMDIGVSQRFGCLIQFSLGNVCSWPQMWSLDPQDIGANACVTEVTRCLQGTVRPVLERVHDDAGMYAFLTQREIEALWPANAAARAAETIYLGKRMKLSQSQVFSDISPFQDYIVAQIEDGMTAQEFLVAAWERA